jgi:DNA-binding CsgD family transcriptional regulator
MLTEREKEVLALIIEGKSNPQIAEKLFISPDTAKAHIEHIFEKFNVHSKVELVVKLFREKIIE